MGKWRIAAYQIGPLDALMRYNKNYRVKYYLVSLPKLTNLNARAAFFLTKEVFDDPFIGLKKFGEHWLTRLFLTGSHSFKRFLLKKSGIQEELKKYLVSLLLPKFIWVCEIYKVEEYQQEQCCGLLIIDATGSKSISSILWYNVSNEWIIRGGIAWKDTIEILPFKISTYRHNLKGEWSKWEL